jgi:glycosyltransferase involved in cell wall biosynthesis
LTKNGGLTRQTMLWAIFMDIALIANGLTNRGEHNYRLIQEVCPIFARRGMKCHVYASRSLDPAIVAEKIAIPHFKHSFYDSIAPRLPDYFANALARWWGGSKRILSYPAEFLTWKVLNQSFRRDLEALPPSCCAAGRLVVITAICQNQLSGLVDFMRARPRDALPCVICQLMFTPSWTPWEGPAQFGEAYYRGAFRKAESFIGHQLFFTAENSAIAEFYREQYGIETKILPVPLAIPRASPVAGKTVRLGFFGYSKASKGFHLLPEAASICQKAGLDVEFRIQVQHSHWERATEQAERKLRRMPNVHLIEGTLASEDYIAEANKIDVVLLPYDPVRFGMRGSGIFTESVSAGRPIIASDGTFAAESIRNGEAQGEIFAPYGARELVNAIRRIIPQISQLRARAEKQAEAFARKHSGEAYVDVLLAIASSACRSKAQGDC